MKQFKFKHLLVVLFHTFILRLVTPIIVLLGLPFAKKAKRKTTHYGQDPDVQRYVLPKWLGILNTADEDGWPMYEATVAKLYNKYGWRFALWYNLGLRNQAQGFLWLFGWECSKELRDNNKLLNYSLLNKQYDVKLFKIVVGWEVARDHYLDYTTSGYYAIPQIDIKFK